MKVFFDANVYMSEVLPGSGAALVALDATRVAKWRIYVSDTVLDEVERVLRVKFAKHPEFARRHRRRVESRATVVAEPRSRHLVPKDPNDTPILRAALASGCDYLVTRDHALLELSPYEGLKIISLTGYIRLLRANGIIG